MQEFLEKNKKEILINIGIIFITLTVYSFIIFGTEIPTILPKYFSNTFLVMLIFPGFFLTLFSAVIWKNFKKALIVGIVTTITWIIVFIIIAASSYSIR